MLPDYIIYDELRRQKEREMEEVDRHRPYLEVPRYVPYWPEERDEDQEDEERDSGVIIIQM